MPSLSKKHLLRGKVIRICILLAIFSLVLLFLLHYPVNLFGIKPSQVSPSTLQHSTVQKVIDGDTIDVFIDGKTERVRLIGIDAPEFGDGQNQTMCFAREALEKAKELLDGKTIRLESDPAQGNRDKYQRLLRYVFLEDGTNINERMIAEGFAHQYSYLGIPYRYRQEFQELERDAKNKKLGLWADGACSVLQ